MLLIARSRARFSPPLPFLRTRRPFLSLLVRWPLLRHWIERRAQT